MKETAPATKSEQRHEEFVTLMTAAHDKLFGYLMSLLGRWHDAQDVLQTSSLLMWRKFESYQPGSNFVAWASTICFYEVKNFRRRSDQPQLVFDDDLLEALASARLVDLEQQAARIAALEQCLKQVKPAERELLRTAYSEHGGIAELAVRQQKAPRTLYNKLTILRQRLSDCVQRRLQKENA